jgi:iron complex transport system ATP-binding protein
MSRVGFTPDTPPLYEEMTVRTFLRFIARGYGLGAGDVDAHISYWLDRVWLAEKASQKIKSLSRGMRQRLGLARTLLPNPSVVLLDEPAAGLDLGGREDLVRRLGDLAADTEAPAMVLVTHHVEEIPPSFTDVLIIRDAKVVSAGPIPITLTAETLSATFGLPLVLEHHGERWSARAES